MKLVRFSIIYIILVILIAQAFPPVSYSWIENTISELSAQGEPNQWIMQLGFIGFGLLLSAGLVLKSIKAGRVFIPDIPILLYAVFVLMTGVFSTEPYLDGPTYSAQEARLHSIFASLSGLFLVLGILLSLILAPTPKEKRFHAIFIILVVAASALFGLAQNYTIPLGKGLAQRGLWVISFAWLWISQNFTSSPSV